MNLAFEIPQLDLSFYFVAMPVLILCVGAIVAMLQRVFPAVGSMNACYGVLVGSLVGALASVVVLHPEPYTFLSGSLLASSLVQFGQATILIIALVVSLLFKETFLAKQFIRSEIISLFLMTLAGMLVMVGSEDLITLFIGLELSSIGLYAIVGYVHPTRRSQEGAIKYFILGSFAAGLLLFGFGLLYTGTGSMQISEIVKTLPLVSDHNWVRLGALFTLAGFGFKLSLVPFHLWAPDAYEAAPTGITAVMATSVKVMILIVATRLFSGGFNELYSVWMPGLMFLAVLSMIFDKVPPITKPRGSPL